MSMLSNQSMEPVDPFSALTTLRSTMNRLFEESVLGLARFDPVARTFALDIQETESTYIIDAALPGVKPTDTEITASDDTLTIRVKRTRAHHYPSDGSRERRTASDKQESPDGVSEAGDSAPSVFVRRERYIGEMSRSITLPSLIIPDKVTAQYEHGILTIHAPKVARVAPKRISVQVSQANVTTPTPPTPAKEPALTH